ncbi:hypothetical protein PFISCL1PPCAC_1907, partial [Pristionchus fissidentatus]
MLFEAPIDILDMRKVSLASATRQLTRTASKSLIDVMNTMNSALSASKSDLSSTTGRATPAKEESIRRPPAPFRRFYSSPSLLPKKPSSFSPKSSTPVEEISSIQSTQSTHSNTSVALAQRMKLLSNLSLSLTSL